MAEAPNPPRLLLVMPTQGRGGAEEYALTVAAEARRRGWEVCAGFPLTPGTGSLRRDLEAMGAAHVPLDLSDLPVGGRARRARRLGRHFLQTLRVIRATRPDVVEIVLPWYGAALGGILACGFLGVPAMVVFQLMPEVAPMPGWLRRLLAAARRRNQRWVAISQHNRACIATSFGMAPAEIALVYNGVDPAHEPNPERAREARLAVRSELGLDPDTTLGVSVGRLHAQKGHADLVRALAAVNQDHALSVVIIGDGPLEAELRALASSCGADQALILAGFRTDVARYLEAADLFLMPSRWEGLAFALLEAMAHGTPVIVSDTGALPEVVADRVHGILHRTGDWRSLAESLNWALENPGAMQLMAQRALIRVQDFSRETMLEQTFGQFEQLLAFAPGRTR